MANLELAPHNCVLDMLWLCNSSPPPMTIEFTSEEDEPDSAPEDAQYYVCKEDDTIQQIAKNFGCKFFLFIYLFVCLFVCLLTVFVSITTSRPSHILYHYPQPDLSVPGAALCITLKDFCGSKSKQMLTHNLIHV